MIYILSRFAQNIEKGSPSLLSVDFPKFRFVEELAVAVLSGLTDRITNIIQNGSIKINFGPGPGLGPYNVTYIVIVVTVSREVKLICLPSDNMGDRGHIKMIIYIYYAIYTDN